MKDCRPNILWICTDQQRGDTIGALGNPHVRTSHLDRLVAEGTAFTRAYCQSPICTPSRASFLTGMYPGSIQASLNGNEEWADAAPLITKTLADTGYDCGLSGKLHLSAACGRIEKRPDDGYRVFHWSHHPAAHWPHGHDYHDWLRKRNFNLEAVTTDRSAIPPELHQSTWCTDRAIEFISEPRSEPWLFSVNTFDPHPPFDPPKEIMETYEIESMPGPLYRETDLQQQARLADIDFQTPCRHPDTFSGKRVQAAYYAMIELIDRNVGRMLEALEQTGQRENTLVLFTSDHGECLGDHGLLQKGCRFYEGLTRVPLVFSWPGRIKQGLRSEALVELTDIVPTLLECCSLPVPSGMHGRSLLPILSGSASPGRHRDAVRCEYYRALGAEAKGFAGTRATMIRDERYKLVVYHGHGTGELFDLENDPDEFENRWDDPELADVRAALTMQSFDALALSLNLGPPQVAAY